MNAAMGLAQPSSYSDLWAANQARSWWRARALKNFMSSPAKPSKREADVGTAAAAFLAGAFPTGAFFAGAFFAGAFLAVGMPGMVSRRGRTREYRRGAACP